MLDPVERAEVAADFGVAESQVELDHFISHVLLAIAGLELPLVFFGGTALARTHLSDPFNGGRLSEDIDLYAPSRRRVASVLDQRLPQAVRREFPRAFGIRGFRPCMVSCLGSSSAGRRCARTAGLVRSMSGLSVQPHYFSMPPRDWAGQLGHQTGQLTSADECLAVVRQGFAEALGWDKDDA